MYIHAHEGLFHMHARFFPLPKIVSYIKKILTSILTLGFPFTQLLNEVFEVDICSLLI